MAHNLLLGSTLHNNPESLFAPGLIQVQSRNIFRAIVDSAQSGGGMSERSVPDNVVAGFILAAQAFAQDAGSIVVGVEGALPILQLTMKVLSEACDEPDGQGWVCRRDRAKLVLGILGLIDERRTHHEAHSIMNRIVDLVETHFSGVLPGDVSRMGGPDEAHLDIAARAVEPNVWKYRHRFHMTVIGVNGAIEIRERRSSVWQVVLEKPGHDGRHVTELLGVRTN